MARRPLRLAHSLRPQRGLDYLLANHLHPLQPEKHLRLPLGGTDSGHTHPCGARPAQRPFPQGHAPAGSLLRPPAQGRCAGPLRERHGRVRGEYPGLHPDARRRSGEHGALSGHALLPEPETHPLRALHAATGGLCHLWPLAQAEAQVGQGAGDELAPHLAHRRSHRRPESHQGLHCHRLLEQPLPPLQPALHAPAHCHVPPHLLGFAHQRLPRQHHRCRHTAVWLLPGAWRRPRPHRRPLHQLRDALRADDSPRQGPHHRHSADEEGPGLRRPHRGLPRRVSLFPTSKVPQCSTT